MDEQSNVLPFRRPLIGPCAYCAHPTAYESIPRLCSSCRAAVALLSSRETWTRLLLSAVFTAVALVAALLVDPGYAPMALIPLTGLLYSMKVLLTDINYGLEAMKEIQDELSYYRGD